MARIRQPGESLPPPQPPTEGPGASALATLLHARRFRIGPGAARVAEHLAAHGGEIAADAAAWIGAVRPPAEAPSVSLGEHPGTLGPGSFGFLNLHGGIAALDAPLPALPRRGALALVVPRRDALPDLVPLALARGLGLSWIVSVGDADPSETLGFLGRDPVTDALAIRLGPGADGATLRAVLGSKPAVVWGGDSICRAVARRAGARVAERVEEFLAQATLLDAGVEAGSPVRVLVAGGGLAFVAQEVTAAGLDAQVVGVDERAPDELAAEVARAHASGQAVILVAGTPPLLPNPTPGPRLLSADLRHPEELRALLAALAAPRSLEADDKPPRARIDKELVAKVRAEVDVELSDHDAKRLLKAYGAKVSRQAPTSTPTGATKLARTLGLPVAILSGELGPRARLPPPGDASAEERVAESLPEVRRLAALLLEEVRARVSASAAGGAPRSTGLMVRERFPELPRVRARIAHERGVGLTLRVGEACALLPLTRADALALAATTAARRAVDQRALAELLLRVAACADGEDALFEVELYVGAEPAIVSSAGTLRR